MKILVVAVGTRGDIEPFVRIGEVLTHQGHQVVYQFPQQLCHLAGKQDNVYPLSGAFLDLIDSPAGRRVMAGTGNIFQRLRDLWTLYSKGKVVNNTMLFEQKEAVDKEQPDAIIHHIKANYPVLWAIQTGKKAILASPVPYLLHPTKGQPHIGVTWQIGEWFNRLSYRLVRAGIVKTIGDAATTLQLPSQKKAIKEALYSQPLVYTISQALIPRDSQWPRHVHQVGYLHRHKKSDQHLDSELTTFLQSHDKVVLVTFGSMTNDKPDQISAMLYDTLTQLQIPAVLNLASGGLVKSPERPDSRLIHYTDSVPYDALLPHIYAVVHHGGSGTTHLGLLHGCPTLVLSHIMDQVMWGRLIHRIGVGPKSVPVNRLTRAMLSTLLSDLLSNPSYKVQAQEIGDRMQAETSEHNLQHLLKEILL